MTVGAPPGWCFYIESSNSPVWALTFWYWFSFYFWIWVTVIFNFIIYIRISYHKTTLFVEIRKVINDIMFKLVWYPILIVFCWSIVAIVDTIVTIDSTSFDLFPNYNQFVEITAIGIPCSQGILLALIYWTTMKSARIQLIQIFHLIFNNRNNKIAVTEILVTRKQPNIIGMDQSYVYNDNYLQDEMIQNQFKKSYSSNNSFKKTNRNRNQRVSFSDHSIEKIFDLESNVSEGLILMKNNNSDISKVIYTIPTIVNVFPTINNFVSPLTSSSQENPNHQIRQLSQQNLNKQQFSFQNLTQQNLTQLNFNINGQNQILQDLSQQELTQRNLVRQNFIQQSHQSNFTPQNTQNIQISPNNNNINDNKNGSNKIWNYFLHKNNSKIELNTNLDTIIHNNNQNNQNNNVNNGIAIENERNIAEFF